MFVGQEHRGIAIAVDEGIGDDFFGQACDLVEHGADGVDIEIAVPAAGEDVGDWQ